MRNILWYLNVNSWISTSVVLSFWSCFNAFPEESSFLLCRKLDNVKMCSVDTWDMLSTTFLLVCILANMQNWSWQQADGVWSVSYVDVVTCSTANKFLCSELAEVPECFPRAAQTVHCSNKSLWFWRCGLPGRATSRIIVASRPAIG